MDNMAMLEFLKQTIPKETWTFTPSYCATGGKIKAEYNFESESGFAFTTETLEEFLDILCRHYKIKILSPEEKDIQEMLEMAEQEFIDNGGNLIQV